MDGLDVCETVTGTVENVVYRNEENDYTVLEINSDGELVTAVGTMPLVFEGERVTLSGQWTFHKEFGKQFAFVSYDKRLPDDTEGILQYLSSRTVKGIGPVTALKIVNRYGTDTFDVLENHPEWLTDITGITMKKAGKISESFREQSEMRSAMMFFKDYMGTGEITRVYKKLGSSAVGIVMKNPYILCEGDYGIPFEKADAIAASVGISKYDRERVFSGVNFVLSHNAQLNGHTCLPKEKLIADSARMLGIEEPVVLDKIDYFTEERRLAQYSDGKSIFVMSADTEDKEIYIAKRIKEMSSAVGRFSSVDISALIQTVEMGMGIRYADMQREALFRVLDGGVTIITGGPGTGKTTVIKAMIGIFKNIGWKYALAAPTGRAAKRMSEATGEEAKTVHRMLEMERVSGEEAKFNRNSAFPLDEHVVIIDEASMLDLSLTNALIRAMRRGSRLILIGDSDQLPSVGAGDVLADLIESGEVQTVMLNEIFRQSKESLIVTNAHKINEGIPPVLNVTDNDFFFVRRENERDIPSAVAELITTRLPKTYGENIRERIQVITPSKKGVGGVEALNGELQARINPPLKFKKEKAAHGVIFREGDRVMQITNDYDIEWEKNGITGYGVFNGDIGVIESIDNTDEYLYIRFDDRYVKYGFDSLDELDLAYAITVHKSQGSEYPVVIVPMYSCAPMLMTRNLLYTAVTRARNMVILVGRSDIPGRMAKNNVEILRYTTLANRLREE